jgi:DNA-binding beta-propeller fold protein YncE
MSRRPRLRRRWPAALAVLAALPLLTMLAAPPATATGPAATTGPTVKLVSSFGYVGRARLYAYGLAYDPTDSTMLVGDLWNNRVERWTTGGQLIGTVSKNGPPGGFSGISQPFGVAADPGGNVWVADASRARIVEFDHNGNYLFTRYTVFEHCPGATVPTNLAFDTDPSSPFYEYLFVSDPRCGRVYVFDHAGNFKWNFQWNLSSVGITVPIPRGLAVDSNPSSPTHGDVFVSEMNSRRIFEFTETGIQLDVFAPTPDGTDLADPRGMVLDQSRGILYTVGAANNMVVLYKTDGTFLTSWGANPSTGRDFNSIRYVTVDQAGNVYVSDLYGYWVWKMDPTGKLLPWGPNPPGPPPKGGLGPPNGGYNNNLGIAVDNANHTLYVVDTFENRVDMFNTNSTCPTRTYCPGSTGSFGHRGPLLPNSSDLDYPHVITYGAGYLFMDATNGVLQLNPDGSLVSKWPVTKGTNPDQFQYGPEGIAVANGAVYTTDYGTCYLAKWSYTGTPIAQWSSCGNGPDQMLGPHQLAVLGTAAFVADSHHNRIAVWNLTTGHIVRSITGFNQPSGVALDPTGTWLYVADTNNKRVVRVHLDGSSPEVVTTTAGSRTLGGPRYLAFDASGGLYVSDANHSVYLYSITG